MKKYENIYIYTDVDGTISDWNFNVPRVNLEALKYFTENGGHFGIATGRGKRGVEELSASSYINMPVILGNGAVVTEIDKEPLSCQLLPKKAREVALEMRDKFPNIAIYCWGLRERYDMSDKIYCKREDKFSFTIPAPIEKVTEPWSRLLFYTEPEQKEEMTAYVKKLSKDELEMTTSGKSCIGLMAKGVNKGKALERIIEEFRIERKNLYVLGDFDNDLPMLSLEGVNSLCPSTAESCVKEIADDILCPVEEGILPLVLKKIDENLK